MEHYSLNEENQPTCSNPFPAELSENIKQMVIKTNTKFRNIVSYVEKQMEKQNARRVIFCGTGTAAEKCISCVEYFKGRYTQNTGELLYQWSILQQAVGSDIWKPDNELMSTLKVELKVPAMYIMVSRDPFPDQYQCSSMQSTNEEYPSFLKKQKRIQEPRKNKNPAKSNKSREDVNPNPWRRPEKTKLGKGSKKRKADAGLNPDRANVSANSNAPIIE